MKYRFLLILLSFFPLAGFSVCAKPLSDRQIGVEGDGFFCRGYGLKTTTGLTGPEKEDGPAVAFVRIMCGYPLPEHFYYPDHDLSVDSITSVTLEGGIHIGTITASVGDSTGVLADIRDMLDAPATSIDSSQPLFVDTSWDPEIVDINSRVPESEQVSVRRGDDTVLVLVVQLSKPTLNWLSGEFKWITCPSRCPDASDAYEASASWSVQIGPTQSELRTTTAWQIDLSSNASWPARSGLLRVLDEANEPLSTPIRHSYVFSDTRQVASDSGVLASDLIFQRGAGSNYSVIVGYKVGQSTQVGFMPTVSWPSLDIEILDGTPMDSRSGDVVMVPIGQAETSTSVRVRVVNAALAAPSSLRTFRVNDRQELWTAPLMTAKLQLAEGSHVVRVSDDAGRVASKTVNVTPFVVRVAANPNSEVTPGTQIELTADGEPEGPYTYVWTLPDGSQQSVNPIYDSPSETSIYTVRMMDSGGVELARAATKVEVTRRVDVNINVGGARSDVGRVLVNGTTECLAGSPCYLSFNTGEQVALQVALMNDSRPGDAYFKGWTGDCAAFGDDVVTTLTVEGATSCTAEFDAGRPTCQPIAQPAIFVGGQLAHTGSSSVGLVDRDDISTTVLSARNSSPQNAFFDWEITRSRDNLRVSSSRNGEFALGGVNLNVQEPYEAKLTVFCGLPSVSDTDSIFFTVVE